MKILTNIRFAQTAGIAQVILSFIDFVEKSKGKNLSIVGVNISNNKKSSFKKVNAQKTSTITIGVKVPNIAKVINKSKNLEQVKKAYEKVISAYQKAIINEKPNLVLINGTYYLPWCLFLACERENVPAVLHYHGVLAKEVQNWKKRQKKIFLEMEKCFDKKNIFYIFPSKITKNVVEKEVFGHKIKKAVIIPNPVPEHFFLQEEKINKKNIGIISRWTGIKNVRFCEELAIYNSKNGNRFVVNVITDLDKNHSKYKELSEFVKFHKPKTNEKLASFYRDMGVVISPSHFETYGNVAKESIASGTPAMISSNMGVSETFKNLGLHNWIIDFNSVEDVYKKIENVMGENVHVSVKDKMKKLYSPCKIFNQIISVLTTAA
jgi:glycosyltransferase involved in cell wall biosynthesis